MAGEEIAEIVHDLKSPLATIALESNLLDLRLARGEVSDSRSAIERIAKNVAFVDRLVNDLLDLCCEEAGHLELQRAPTELRALIEQTVDRAVPSAERGRIFVDPGDPIVLAIDDARIERVIANLVQNALSYSPACSGVVVRLDARRDAACVSVIDAGPGLTATERDRIFERFTRGDSGRGRRGSGLGLYVSKRIVEAHGGRMGVESVHGAGSRFYFELPIEQVLARGSSAQLAAVKP